MPVRVLEIHLLLETGKVLTARCGFEKPFANLFAHIMQTESLASNAVFLYGGGRDTPDRGYLIYPDQTPSDLCLQSGEFIAIFEPPRHRHDAAASGMASSSRLEADSAPGMASAAASGMASSSRLEADSARRELRLRPGPSRLKTPSRSPKMRRQHNERGSRGRSRSKVAQERPEGADSSETPEERRTKDHYRTARAGRSVTPPPPPPGLRRRSRSAAPSTREREPHVKEMKAEYEETEAKYEEMDDVKMEPPSDEEAEAKYEEMDDEETEAKYEETEAWTEAKWPSTRRRIPRRNEKREWG